MTEARYDRFWPIVLTLMATDFIASLEASMIFSALPTIAREYGNFASAGWVISSFTLVQAVAAAIGGRLGDIFGRRRVLVIVLLLSAVGSLISALSAPLELIIAGRSLQGVSGAILPLSFGIIRENTTQQRASFGAGMVVGAYSISGAFGFVLGGLFADAGDWRGIFHLTAGLPLVAVAAVQLFVPRGAMVAKQKNDIDLIGAIALLPAVGGLLLGFTFGSQSGWLSLKALGPLIGGLIILGFWVWYELRRVNPLINLRRLKNRTVSLSLLGYFFLGCGPLQNALIILGLMQQPGWTGIGLGLGGAAAGIAKVPSNLISIFSGGFGGRLSERNGGRLVGIGGAGVLVAGWVMVLAGGWNLWLLIAASLLCSVGLTVVMAAVPALLMEVTPAEETSEVTGFAYLVRAIGMSIGAQLIAVMLASSTITEPGTGKLYPSPLAFEIATGSVILIAIVCLALAAAIPGKARIRRESTAGGIR